MSFVAWLLLGLVCGVVMHRLQVVPGEGQLLDIVLGMVGAFWSGLLTCSLLGCDLSLLQLPTLPIAAIGAVAAIALYHRWGRRKF